MGVMFLFCRKQTYSVTKLHPHRPPHHRHSPFATYGILPTLTFTAKVNISYSFQIPPKFTSVAGVKERKNTLIFSVFIFVIESPKYKINELEIAGAPEWGPHAPGRWHPRALHRGQTHFLTPQISGTPSSIHPELRRPVTSLVVWAHVIFPPGGF